MEILPAVKPAENQPRRVAIPANARPLVMVDERGNPTVAGWYTPAERTDPTGPFYGPDPCDS